ncbi:hypothetical protein OIE66_10145 [Nonomuraea sp. NBC_01738]|uniref:hypothetical protein n=1 Tax=Nonomuraea sp. NBC_01738 TaxID=2976003 RepID=UPI002E11A138|nr:hypothetical protein OIE66_10145 [Nonomuraea sp. NBC_01738]
MADSVTYYAIVRKGYPVERPAGMLRRTVHERGTRDEAINKDLQWRRTGLIVEWEARSFEHDLEVVTDDQAAHIIEDFRTRWSTPD